MVVLTGRFGVRSGLLSLMLCVNAALVFGANHPVVAECIYTPRV